jgi:hydrocephalus-inducing protein
LTFTLKTARLGRIQLPCQIRAVGSSLPPIEFGIAARSIGPILRFGSPTAPSPTATVAFGKVSVLEIHRSRLQVFNASSIAANFKSFVAGKDSAFSVSVREATLAAGEAVELEVAVQLDETYAFNDTLHFLVENGDELRVPLSATGTGNTLYCKDLTYKAELDFSHQFTSQAFSKVLTVENHGRRSASVQWVNQDFERVKKELGKSVLGPQKEVDMNLIPLNKRTVFTIEPSRATIAAKFSQDFVITGFSQTAGLKSEQLQLLTGIGKSVCNQEHMYSFMSAHIIHFPYALIAGP